MTNVNIDDATTNFEHATQTKSFDYLPLKAKEKSRIN